jgi:DNA polymerase-3 subunit alpha
VQLDRFSGGLRLTAQQLWDLPAARARFGRYLRVAVHSGQPPIAQVIQTWPARRLDAEEGMRVQGLGVRLRLQRPRSTAELDLGETARFWPCDEALSRWRQLAHGGQAEVVYEVS